MAVQRGLLLIADIAGYTRFMEFHRADLAHAQDVVARLLEAMIDASSALDLVEVEGDAALMYRPWAGGTGADLVEQARRQAVAMRTAFHARVHKLACVAQQRETLGVVLRALPYALGLRKLGGLRNLTPV